MRAQVWWLLLFVAAHAVAQKPEDFPSRASAAPPQINASENTVINYTGAVPATFSGALDADDSTYNRPVSCAALSGVGIAVAYDTVTINNPTGAAANVVVTGTAPGGGVCGNDRDTVFTLYDTTFNPASPLSNCLAVHDDIGGASNRCSTLSFSVPAGGTRIVAVAGFNNAALATGQFAYEISFAGTATTCGTGSVANGNDAGAGSLRQAIADACPGDTITFAPAVTTVTLTSAELAIAKDLTIDGGAGVAVARQAGSPEFRIFNIAAGNTVVLDGLTISNGSAASEGGGIFNAGTLTVVDSTVTGNASTAGNGGGGIANRGTLTFSNGTISNNTSAFTGGGVLQIDGGTMTLSHCLVSGNTAATDGGGLTSQSIIVAATLTVTNCTFTANNASVNAALLNVANGAAANANAVLTNNTFAGNVGPGRTVRNAGGAGVATMSLRNNVYANNASQNVSTGGVGVTTSLGGNVSDDASGGGGPGDLINTDALLAPLGNYGGPTQTYALLPGSPAINTGTAAGAPTTDQRGVARPQLAAIDSGAFESRGFVLSTVSGTPQSTTVGSAFAAPLVVGIVANQAGEPVNGGQVTFTAPGAGASATLTTSPATIAGGQASATATANATVGAYNVSATASGATGTPTFALTNTPLCVVDPVVTSSADAGAGSLRQAIADACVGSTITFAPGVATVTLTSAELLINKNLTIDGGATGVTIARSAAAGTPNFRVINAFANVSLSRLTIVNGNTSGFGGGVRANSGNLTLNDSVVRNNVGGTGGGVSQAFGILTMNRTLVEGNQGVASGVYVQDSSATITASTIRNNTGFGSGLRVQGAGNQVLQMVNSTISGNTSANEESALRVASEAGATTTVTLVNSTIVNNSTTTAGWAAITRAGSAAGTVNVTLLNTIVSGNRSNALPADSSVAFDPASANNLIGTGGGLSNGVNGNIVGVNDPVVAPSGNYGGTTPTNALLPGSPAINAGTAAGAPATDQRGIARPQLAGIDIGAYESRGFTLALASGTPQSGPLDAAFAAPLVVGVTANAAGEPVDGGRVSYAAPGAGASAALVVNPATIAGGQASVIATANGTPGSYNVTAASNGASGTPTFALTNVRTIDLGVTLTDSPDPVIAGNQLTYVATLGNAGPNDALDVLITLPLPAGTTYASSTSSAGASCTTPAVGANGTVACNWAGATPIGTPRTVTVVALVGAAVANGTVLSATAVAAGAGTDTAPGNNSATTTTTVSASANLSITKTDGSPTAIPGTNTVYTVVVTNAGPSVATGATVTDNFPAETIFCSWTCAGSGGGTCGTASGFNNIAETVNLPVLGSVTYTISCPILPGATGTLVNTASVAPPVGVNDPELGNNSATDTDTLVPTIDIEAFKYDDQDTDVPGTSITYTILVANLLGPSNAVGTTVTDIMSADLTNVTWTCAPANGATCTAAGTGNINDVINLPVAGEALYTVNATIAPSATGTLSNTVSAVLRAGEFDPNLANSTATDTTLLTPEADVSITLTDSPDPVVAGTNLTYLATLTNTGPSDAQGVNITLPLPAGTTFVSATPSAGGACAGTTTVTCTWAGVTAAAGVRTATIVVAVSASQTADLSATATAASSTTDPTPGNNTATATTVVQVQADLSVTLTDAPDPVTAGTQLTYTAVISNAGPSDATAVVLTLPTPANTSLVSGSVSGGSACAGSPVVCTVTGSMAPGSSRTVSIVMLVAASAPEGSVISATATVTAGSPDPNAANNSATTTTNVITSADLVIGLTASTAQAFINVPVTFTATSLNNGPSDAQNVSITLTLTPDFRYSSFVATGATCTTPQVGSTGAIVCTWAGATAPGVTRTLTVVAFSNVEGPTGVNASTTSNTSDPVANNNLTGVTVQVGYLIEEIPTLSGLGLILMGLMFGLMGFVAVRRQG